MTVFVERHRNGIDDVRLGGDLFDAKTLGNREGFQSVFWFDWFESRQFFRVIALGGVEFVIGKRR